MAEMDTSGGGHKKGPGVKKSKKLSTRVDLTPMVDLGFLLITFFIFTSCAGSREFVTSRRSIRLEKYRGGSAARCD